MLLFSNFHRALSIIVAVTLSFIHVSLVYAADQVVSNCSNDSDLRTKLTTLQTTGGGILTFNCGAPTTIILSGTPLPNITIPNAITIDGGNSIALSGNNALRIFFFDFGTNVTLKNIVLTRGLAPNGTSGQGGAIFSYGTLHGFGVSFLNNQAGEGGALYATADTDFHDSGFENNSATGNLGGGAVSIIPVANNNFFFGNTAFTGNQALATGVVRGGAILIRGTNAFTAMVNITHSSFDNNSIFEPISKGLRGRGGAISVDFQSQLFLNDSSLEQNSADAAGALNIEGGADIERDTFFGNSSGAGGAIFNLDGTLTLVNSTFVGNSATLYGGAIYNEGVTTANNLTFSRNAAKSGASIFHASFAANVTFSLNDSIFEQGIQSGNCFSSVAPPGVAISATAFNLSDDASCKFGPAHDNVPLLLGPLQSNGGPTSTLFPQLGSPVLDSGSGCPPVDQRGVARPFGAACDLGAVEFTPLPPVTPTVTPSPQPTIDPSVVTANNIIGSLSSLVETARKKLPGKPSKFLPKSKRNKINAQRKTIQSARSTLKSDLNQLIKLETSAGVQVRVSVTGFTKANLTAIKSNVIKAIPLSDSNTARAKSFWKKVLAGVKLLG